MKKLSLKTKLGMGFGGLLLLLAVLGLISYVCTFQFSDSFDRSKEAMTNSELSVEVELALEKQISAIRGYMVYGQDDMLRRDEEAKTQLSAALASLREKSDEQEKKMLSDIDRSQAEYRTIADQMIQLTRSNKVGQAKQLGLSAQMTQARNSLRLQVAAFKDAQQKEENEAVNRQQSLETDIRVLALSIGLLGLGIGAAIAIFMIRSITNGVGQMLGLIQEIAANNLAAIDMNVTSEDEIGKAGTALNRMKNNLHEMIQSIASTAEHVASASEEISSSATQQAQGAETQKDQATQVATAMQEMSSTVMQVSDNSNKAAEAARKAADTAKRGGNIVDETLTKMRVIADSVSGTARKMEELGKSSDQIGRIIGVIDDIADQTNLLALNAAIEAARAGEQGRGFAVVADEVRKLAERTTSATKEIAQMIKNIQDETKTAVSAMEQGTKQVEEGVMSTAQAGDALKEIIMMADQVGEMITHIATAATEQSSASEQVNNNMDEIAKLVKESATGAQQSAKACQDLSGLALDLQKMVSNFKLENGGNGYQKPRNKRVLPAAQQSERPAKAFAAAAH